MDDVEVYNPEYEVFNNENEELQNLKKIDRGVNYINRLTLQKDGTWKQKSKTIYTSSGFGSYIRDAETGQFYKYKVGSADEDLFFKVTLATGECKSNNGSSTLFFCGPKNYMNYLNAELSHVTINNWEQKRNNRIKVINKRNVKYTAESITVN